MQLLRRLSFTMLLMSLMTLVACGGGGGDLSGGGENGGTDTFTIQIAKSDGDLSGANDVVVSVLVQEGNLPVANKLVTFTVNDESLATFSPAVGTAVTDANGIASITVKATSIAGGIEVTAAISEIDPVSIGFTSIGGGTGGEADVLAIELSMSSKEVSASNPPTVTARVTYGGQPVADELVTFSVDNTDLATLLPETGTASTNNEGVATIVITAAGTAGAGIVSASINDLVLATTTFNSLGDGNDDGSPDVANISLLASNQQIASSGAQKVTLSAIAKDSNNELLEGVTINFSADSGALEKIIDDDGNIVNVTGPDGKVTRELSTLGEPTNRIITITAASGQTSDTIEIQVVGTSLSLTGSSSLALNTENTFVIKVSDSDGNNVKKGTIVELSLVNESTEVPAGSVAAITIPETVEVGSDGQATFVAIGTSGGTNTIKASTLGASAMRSVSVQADSFLFTDFGDGTNNVNPSAGDVPDILLSKTANVTLTWLRSGVPVPDGTDVQFTTTRGTLSQMSAKTVSGKVSTTLTSTNAGKALITFTGTDVVDGKSIELNNQLGFEFVADTADRLIAQAFPQTIGPNEQTSTVSVVVKDALGNLVKNKVVDFVLTDTNGGAIFPASAVTDSNGSASTVYTSNSTSAENGVSIQAIVRETPDVSDEVFLTVAEREAFITLGTGNSVIIDEDDETIYIKKYSVFVTDINSRPIENVTLTVSAIPRQYFKGYWVPVYDDGEFDHYETLITARCDNEDKNRNSEVDAGEDDDPVNGNNDGELTPGNLVSVFGNGMNAEVVTDEQGRAVLDIVYPESFGGWATIDLVVSTKVGGTESFARGLHLLYVAASDVVVEGNPPGGNIHGLSDFGTASVCTDPN